MIITKKYAKKLAKAGKATIEPSCTIDAKGNRWQIVTRHDILRVDHYQVD